MFWYMKSKQVIVLDFDAHRGVVAKVIDPVIGQVFHKFAKNMFANNNKNYKNNKVYKGLRKLNYKRKTELIVCPFKRTLPFF